VFKLYEARVSPPFKDSDPLNGSRTLPLGRTPRTAVIDGGAAPRRVAYVAIRGGRVVLVSTAPVVDDNVATAARPGTVILRTTGHRRSAHPTSHTR